MITFKSNMVLLSIDYTSPVSCGTNLYYFFRASLRASNEKKKQAIQGDILTMLVSFFGRTNF